MGKMSRTRGKNNELATMHFWGVRRNHFEAEDLTGHALISIECKARSKPIKTLAKWMAQAKAAAEPGKAPVVHFHVQGQEREKTDLVIMRAADLRDIIGRGGKGYRPTDEGEFF